MKNFIFLALCAPGAILSFTSGSPAFTLIYFGGVVAAWWIVIRDRPHEFDPVERHYYDLMKKANTDEERRLITNRKQAAQTEAEQFLIGYYEAQEGRFDPTIWAKAYATTKGNETEAKALYTRLRFEQVKAEARQKLEGSA